jgi:hypothetical protein
MSRAVGVGHELRLLASAVLLSRLTLLSAWLNFLRKADMSDNEQTEPIQPPIGLAGFACVTSLLATFFVIRFTTRFIDIEWLTWFFAAFIPVLITFVILHRSAWHQELSTVARIFSLLLSACLIYAIVLAFLGLAVIVSSVFFHNGMISS